MKRGMNLISWGGEQENQPTTSASGTPNQKTHNKCKPTSAQGQCQPHLKEKGDEKAPDGLLQPQQY